MAFDNTTFDHDLDTAIRSSKDSNRFELADYFDLKVTNDKVREEAKKWLFDSVNDIVHAFNGHGAKILTEHLYKKQIKYFYSSLTGERLELRQGLRCMTLEVGWTRSIDDGVMRAGSLAFGRISHFGFRKEMEEIELHRFEGNPQWFAIGEDMMRTPFSVASLKKHFKVLMSM